MKANISTHNRGVTLIELTIVIGILILLASSTTIGFNIYQDWKKGLDAGEQIKAVYQAQKLYLADNPTVTVDSITADNLLEYLPDNMDAIPVITGLDGANYEINVNVSPPTIDTDFSGTPDDSLWDAGK
ncbi:type II secretion system protein [Rubritalea tangerina]|uniref:Type II secretion system protein n=1 Tax=Rubritalea tangerina TaxID=430798 RepID=A0ABW4Z650_9BACT